MKNSVENFHKIVDDLNTTISILIENDDVDNKQRKRDVDDIRKDIQQIRDMLVKQEAGSIGISKIRIRFDGEYELKLPKYGIEKFDRNLKGDMYFSVLGGNDEYIDMKTKSFPDYFRIRLKYKTLEQRVSQRGEAYLVYRRGSDYMEGDETKMTFEILSKS